MGGGGGGIASSPLATAATGGSNVLHDQLLQRAGVQGGLNSVAGNLGQQFSESLGAGIDKPQLAQIQAGVSPADVQRAQGGVNTSLESQQALLKALQAQNGMGVQNQAVSGLQGLAAQYQNIASGQGPNPAQAMLNQQTGANVANQAALMAGQRGAGANAGMLARQAAQQGAATQQQAVGQGATMQANQSLNALQGLGQTQQALGGMGNTMVGNQMAATQAGAQGNLTNAAQQQQALAALNQANVSSQGNVNAANAGLLNTGMQGKQKIAGGLMSGAGAAIGMAEGGAVPSGPQSSFGNFLHGWKNSTIEAPASQTETGVSQPSAPADLETGTNKLVSALGKFKAAEGGLAKTGGHVKAKAPEQKAVASGNSYSNDKVPAMLSEGEIVLPRSVTMSKDPIKASAAFVQQVLAKRRMK